MTTWRTRRNMWAAIVALGVAVATTPTATEAATQPGGTSAGPACASIPPDGEGSFVGMADDPAVTAASNNPELTTVASAIEAAGLIDTLNGEGPFTIFAPNNAAFAKIPQADLDAIIADTAQLTDVLTYHVVSGASLSSADLAAAGSVVTAQGGELTFTAQADGTLSINGGAATIVCSNISVGNGTLHVVDSVLLPMAVLMPATR